jgi:pilus assembly protein CpaB
MKPAVRIGLVAVAAVSAIALAVVVRGALSGKPTSQAAAAVPVEQPKPTTRVLVAKRELKVGERLAPEDMGWQEWPVEALNAAFTTDGTVNAPPPPPPTIPELCNEEVRAAERAESSRTPPKAKHERAVKKCVEKKEKEAKKAAKDKKPAKKGEPATTQAATAVATVTRTVADLADGGPRAKFVGAVVREAILQGEPIVDRKLVQAGQSGYLAVVLAPGMRAMAVSVKVETAAGGFILPGDRVDVILSRELTGEQRNTFISETVLRNVKVLAVDQVTQPNKNETTVVGATATLEVSSTSAEALALAKAQGDLSLTLRSYADAGEPSGVVARTTSVGAMSSSAAAATTTVRVFRNGEATAVSVNP